MIANSPLALLSKILGIYNGRNNEKLLAEIAHWKVKKFTIKSVPQSDSQIA
jgi:hypothetical protein